MHDPFEARSSLRTRDGQYTIYRLDALERAGLGDVARLPYSVKIQDVLKDDKLSDPDATARALLMPGGTETASSDTMARPLALATELRMPDPCSPVRRAVYSSPFFSTMTRK